MHAMTPAGEHRERYLSDFKRSQSEEKTQDPSWLRQLRESAAAKEKVGKRLSSQGQQHEAALSAAEEALETAKKQLAAESSRAEELQGAVEAHKRTAREAKTEAEEERARAEGSRKQLIQQHDEAEAAAQERIRMVAEVETKQLMMS